MMKRLDEEVAGVEYENFVNATKPERDTFHVNVRAGQGVLRRRSALALSAGGAAGMALLGTDAAEGETLTANCILAEDVDTGTSGTATAIAYRTGHFNRNALICKEGYTLTAADEEELRKGGIFLDDAI